MAGFVYKNAYLSIGGNDISSYIQSCKVLGAEYDEVDMTAMGDAAHNGIPGLGTWQIEVTCKQSFAAGELDSIIFPLVGAEDASPVIFKPKGPTTGSGNPKWTGNGRIYSYPPIEGSVGDGAKTSFTIKPGDGSMLARAIAD